MQADSKKIFIISLDGATFGVITPLASQGYLPHLSAMMSASFVSELESVIPPVTAPAWTSFMTGKHPNKHGIFDFSKFSTQHYNWTINNANDIQSKTIWQILSQHDKRVVALNLPYTYPPSEVNGIIVSGWDAPFTDDAFSCPSSVGGEIVKKYPDYKNNLWISELQPLRSDAHFDELKRKLIAGFEQQAAIAIELLKREPWDVFMVHFQQTDWIQHKLWTYIEQGCNNPADHSSKVESTRDCYRRFDELVGNILKEIVPESPTTIVLSDHGFGRLMGNINPNYYLEQWGYLTVRKSAPDKLKPVKNLLRRSKSKTIQKVYRSLTEAKHNFQVRASAQDHKSWSSNAGDVMGSRGATWDWSKTKAAIVYAYQMGFVYVNLVGRGPLGIVEPGAEYEAVVTDLIARFRKLTHPDSGEKLLLDVARGADVYPAVDNGITVPDLVLFPKDGYGFSFSLADSSPRVSEEGTHRHNGIVFIKGPQIVSSKSSFAPQLVDVAPTILHLLGLPVPTDMDGRVWEEIIKSDHAVRYEDVDNSLGANANEYRQEESDIIAQRLQGLGYLE